MKEYEFIVTAIEEVLSDRLIALICLENYGIKSRPDGYRTLFDRYNTLQKEFKESIIPNCGDEISDEQKEIFELQWQVEREKMLNTFMNDLLKAESNIGLNVQDIEEHKKKYEELLKDEDVQTLGKRIGIYPYLISSVYAKGGGKEKC